MPRESNHIVQLAVYLDEELVSLLIVVLDDLVISLADHSLTSLVLGYHLVQLVLPAFDHLDMSIVRLILTLLGLDMHVDEKRD